MRHLVFAALAGALGISAIATPAQADDPVRGVVRAVRDATIATELNARVARVAKRDGDSFETGDLLLEFDCAKQRAELEAARAEDSLNRAAYENAVELDRRKAIGKFDVRAARSKWDQARATAAALEAVVKNCRIVAPFSGQITDMRIRDHEMSQPGQPLFRIVDGGELELDFIVASNWLTWMKPGAPMRVRVEETGATLEAQVRRIAGAVDPVSQTVRITAVFSEPSGGVLPGMSVAALFDAPGN